MESPLEVWRILIIGCFLEYFPMPSMPASRKVYTTTILRLQSVIHLSTTFPPRFSNSRDQFLTESELSAQIPFQMLRGGRSEREKYQISKLPSSSSASIFSSVPSLDQLPRPKSRTRTRTARLLGFIMLYNCYFHRAKCGLAQWRGAITNPMAPRPIATRNSCSLGRIPAASTA